MTSPELERLVAIGQLKREPPARAELEGLIRSAANRLADSRNDSLSSDSRFDLAYSAAHGLALAALRWHGYRSESRYLVFQALPHTLDIPAATWRLLADCHRRRNAAEYEGFLGIDARLLEDLVAAAGDLLEAVSALELPPDPGPT